MAEIEKFEDIEAWQRERQLAKAVYAVTSEGKFARDFGVPSVAMWLRNFPYDKLVSRVG